VSLDCHTREGGYPRLWIPAFAGMTCIVTIFVTVQVLVKSDSRHPPLPSTGSGYGYLYGYNI